MQKRGQAVYLSCESDNRRMSSVGLFAVQSDNQIRRRVNSRNINDINPFSIATGRQMVQE
jgi:hypothetical protein